MIDLKEDFGFHIGGWNQAYQFDTLPVEVPFDQLKPGDLVFYSGTYFNPKKRKQKHDMVHVEIFLGGPTGEQTIGARYTNGVVSYFDSYKFNSKTYYDIKFYFRSLDTWLQGICKSACDEHLWLEDRDFYDSGKFSVFADDDEEGDEVPIEDEKESTSVQKEKKEFKKKTTGYRRVFIGKGNNDKLVKSYFSKENYQLLDSKMTFTDKFDIKWVQTTGEIDFLKFKERSQMVNHIPNINVIASKNGLIQTLKNYESQNSSEISIDDFMPDSYRLDVLEDEVKFVNSENSGIWITKPYYTNQGKNLKIITDIVKFKRDFLKTKRMTLGDSVWKEIFNSEAVSNIMSGKEEQSKDDEEPFQKIDTRVVIQKYIENPLLLNNKKFDIRCYVLVCTMKPLFVLFHPGYCRLCITDYSTGLNEKGQLDKLQHLTNNSVQKRHPEYTKHKEESIWTMPKFETYLEENNIADQAKIKGLYSQIKNILTHCIKSADPVLDKKAGYFQLLGCDILIDQNLKPYLLEINSNPAIFTDIQAHRDVIPKVVFKALDISIELNKKGDDELRELLKNPEEQIDLRDFEVLYNQQL